MLAQSNAETKQSQRCLGACLKLKAPFTEAWGMFPASMVFGCTNNHKCKGSGTIRQTHDTADAKVQVRGLG